MLHFFANQDMHLLVPQNQKGLCSCTRLGTANITANVIALYFYGVTSLSQQAELAKCDTCNALLILCFVVAIHHAFHVSAVITIILDSQKYAIDLR